MSENEDVSQLAELKSFFYHPREDVRAEALRVLSQFTTQAAHREEILKLDIVRDLLPRISDKAIIAEKALTCLVNLSETQALRHKINSLGAVEICMSELKARRKKDILVSKYIVMLLANISLDNQGAKLIMSEGTNLQGLHLLRLLTWFVEPVSSGADTKSQEIARVDPLEYTANIITNVTQLESAKVVLVDPKRDIIRAFYPMFETTFTSSLRRLGCFRCVRNLFMETKHHEYLLSEKLELYPRLMIPLVGPEVLDEDDRRNQPVLILNSVHSTKKRETSNEIRRVLLDILHLCANHKASRLTLKRRNIYPLLRDLHLWEQEQGNDDHDEFLHDLVPNYISKTEPEEEDYEGAKIEEIKDSLVPGERDEKKAVKAAAIPTPAIAEIDLDEDEEDVFGMDDLGDSLRDQQALAKLQAEDESDDEPPPFVEDM